MIPGFNILKTALSAIASQPVKYYRFTGRVTNEIGVDVPEFTSPFVVYGSLQDVPKAKYEAYGLDFNRRYIMLYTVLDVGELKRDSAGDRFEFAGRLFQCQDKADWIAIDGWNAVIAVDITGEAM